MTAILCRRSCIAELISGQRADGVVLMVDQNHGYKAVSQESNQAFLNGVVRERKLPRNSAIIIQNDVWIGSCATIMSGVTMRNGCVVAAKSVVTKDVPPYAIVGGNPARILGYRFDEETIAGLQKIAFWDWSKELQLFRRDDFALPADELHFRSGRKRYFPAGKRAQENRVVSGRLE